jgi:hypothetical protein
MQRFECQKYGNENSNFSFANSVVLIIEDHSELQLTEREVNDFRNIVGIM